MLILIFLIILLVISICLTIFLILARSKNKKLLNEVITITDLYTDLDKNLESLEQLKIQNKKISTELSQTTDKLEKTTDDLEQTNDKLKHTTDDLEQTSDKLKQTSDDLEETSDKLKQTSEELGCKISELNSTQKKLHFVNFELDDKKNKLDLIQSLLNCNKSHNNGVQNYLRLLTEDYYEFAKKNDSLADEANALLRLQKVAKDLDFLSSDKQLHKKTIIAIAGQFSSGKSSFLNSIFQNSDVILPTDLNQSTAINAFIMNDANHSIRAFTNTGGYSNIKQNQFELFNYNEINHNNFNVKKIVDHFVINNSFVIPLDNICFIDTPGYNPGICTDDDYTSAMTSIENSNGLIWCVAATNGTIQADDIDLLADFKNNNPDLKIYIIVNKADLRSDEENEQILDEIDFNVQNIGIEGICLYTSNEFLNEQDYYLNQYIGTDFITFLESLNQINISKKESLIQEIDSVFNDYINADLTRIKHNKNKLDKINELDYLLSTYIDEKDNNILYLRARLDPVYLKDDKDYDKDYICNIDKQFKDNYSAEDSRSDEYIVKNDNMAKYIQIVHDVKEEIKKIIKEDENDIEKAKDLSTKMKNCIQEAFV